MTQEKNNGIVFMQQEFSIGAKMKTEPQVKSISVEEWYKLSASGTEIPVTLKLNGESMRPLIRKQRDAVTVVRVCRELKRGDVVLFLRKDGAYVVHRIWKIKGESIVTAGDNCVECDAPVSASDIRGIVIKAERNGKIINLDSAVSRAFGILWQMTRPLRSVWLKIKKCGAGILKRMRGIK